MHNVANNNSRPIFELQNTKKFQDLRFFAAKYSKNASDLVPFGSAVCAAKSLQNCAKHTEQYSLKSDQKSGTVK